MKYGIFFYIAAVMLTGGYMQLYAATDAATAAPAKVGLAEVRAAKKTLDDVMAKAQTLRDSVKAELAKIDAIKEAGRRGRLSSAQEAEVAQSEHRIIKWGEELESVQKEHIAAYQEYAASVEVYIATPAKKAKSARLKAEYATELYSYKHFNISIKFNDTYAKQGIRSAKDQEALNEAYRSDPGIKELVSLKKLVAQRVREYESLAKKESVEVQPFKHWPMNGDLVSAHQRLRLTTKTYKNVPPAFFVDADYHNPEEVKRFLISLGMTFGDGGKARYDASKKVIELQQTKEGHAVMREIMKLYRARTKR
ncbi:MAG: hypothetical protein IKV82_02805 [Akkermansia sp.]|nr:hypothetical protein [Akkermansia sp.]